MVFHPTGKFLLSASDDYTIRVWELATGRCVKTVQAHGHFVTCLAWGRQAPAQSSDPSAKTNVAVPTAAYDPLATKEDVLFSFLLASLFIYGIRFVIRTPYEVRFNFLCIPGAI